MTSIEHDVILQTLKQLETEMSSDFEVLPVGSTEELITIRKLLARLLEADESAVSGIIAEIRSFYQLRV